MRDREREGWGRASGGGRGFVSSSREIRSGSKQGEEFCDFEFQRRWGGGFVAILHAG